jgi:hypothetical protein
MTHTVPGFRDYAISVLGIDQRIAICMHSTFSGKYRTVSRDKKGEIQMMGSTDLVTCVAQYTTV